jgi:mannosyltransferase
LLFLSFGARILYLSAPSLWLDEAISAKIIEGSIADCIQHAKTDLHPPFYYVLLHLWSYIGRDEFTLRLFSVIANFLSGVILFLCARRMFQPSVALLALLLFTLSPFQIRYSQEVRMYSLLGLWMVLALFFVWEYLKKRSLPFLFGYIFSSALGLYTHYQAGIFLIILNMALAIPLYRQGEKILWRWLPAQLMILVLFSPWIPYFINQFKGGGRSWVPFHPSFPLSVSPLFAFLWGDPVLSKLYHFLWPSFMKIRDSGIAAQWIGTLSLIFLFMAVILKIWKHRNKLINLSFPTLFLILLLVGTFALSYGLSFRSNIYGAKYLFGASFAFYILVAVLLIALTRVNRKIGIGLGIVITTIQVFMLVAYYQPGNHRENWRGAVAHIKGHSGPNQAVGFHFDAPMAPYAYYADDSIPAYGFLREGNLSPSLLAVINSRNNTLWLFDYLAELYDPKEKVKRKLLEHGYVPGWRHDFNGVSLTLWKKAAGSE